MGFTQAPCPALLQSEQRAKIPLTFMEAVRPVLGQKNPSKLARESQKLLWADRWENASMCGGHLRPRWTFKTKTEAYLYNHTKSLICIVTSCPTWVYHADMGLMPVLTTTR